VKVYAVLTPSRNPDAFLHLPDAVKAERARLQREKKEQDEKRLGSTAC
jgi:hypothetical protein